MIDLVYGVPTDQHYGRGRPIWDGIQRHADSGLIRHAR
jgi:hypothetical protein